MPSRLPDAQASQALGDLLNELREKIKNGPPSVLEDDGSFHGNLSDLSPSQQAEVRRAQTGGKPSRNLGSELIAVLDAMLAKVACDNAAVGSAADRHNFHRCQRGKFSANHTGRRPLTRSTRLMSRCPRPLLRAPSTCTLPISSTTDHEEQTSSPGKAQDPSDNKSSSGS